ncbi:dihydrofolate reductase family protein [Paenibacillus bouchesdurhonensis]|uniref:dihydrofolate reductase family protein n=1 Tax=Paenibacillus bouchesdurhonensis TaxID=1870990 RepID=UPI000DA5EFB8|nr:dihydrofolate reductase family protein [Paenibacillus bouchesdurhonensis]
MPNHTIPRKIILDLAVTLDGFIEGENGEVDWCIMDDEMGFVNFLNQIDTILYGRKSYELWGQYTPENEATDSEKEIWSLVHSKEKYVFSKSQKGTDHQASFINNNILEAINQLKNKPGKDIWLYGGASLITTFIHLGLVDELRLSVHPVVLGEGKPLFIDVKQRLNLKLMDTKRFSSGVVQLCYQILRTEE